MLKHILIFFICCFAFGEDALEARLAHIKQEILPKDNDSSLHYIGEIIGVKYNVLIFDNASIKSIDFSPNASVSLKNPDSKWSELEDGSMENIFYFKINNVNFSIPRLNVVVQKGDSSQIEQSLGIVGTALNLSSNRPNYNGVVAKKFEVRDYSVKNYDNKSNIIIFDLLAMNANLEDLSFLGAEKQGFERSSFGLEESSGIYYAIIPNNIAEFSFEFFDITSQSYKTQTIKNVINHTQIAVNVEVNPINKVLLFENIVILCICFIFVILFFVKKIPFKLRLALLIIAVICISYILISFNTTNLGVVKQSANVKILPTKNSTIIEQIPQGAQVNILSEHDNYYKILTNDNKTGWVKKDDIK